MFCILSSSHDNFIIHGHSIIGSKFLFFLTQSFMRQGECAESMGIENIGLSGVQNVHDTECYLTSKKVCGETSEP